MPGCTSFASPPVFTEAMNQEIAVILPEQISILRRESMRQYVATLQWPIASGRPQYGGVRTGGGSWIGVTEGGAILPVEGMPWYGLIPGNPFR